jgi:hypothetical protein
MLRDFQSYWILRLGVGFQKGIAVPVENKAPERPPIPNWFGVKTLRKLSMAS